MEENMKRTFRVLLALCLTALSLCLVFASCGEDLPEDTSSNELLGESVQIETDEATEVTGEVTEGSTVETTAEVTEEATAAPHTHSWSDWSVVRSATCTEDGSEERSCSCGEKETKTIAATGHSEVVDPAVAPTCTLAGKSEGQHCSVCNTVTAAQSEIKATGHSFGEWKTEKAATCKEDGKSVRSCACGEQEAKTVAATGHEYRNGVCTFCGKSDPSVIDADKVYNDAIGLLNSGKYEDAYNKFLSIKDKKDVGEYLDRFVWVCGKENYRNASGEYTSVTEYKYNDNGYLVQILDSDSRGEEYITDYYYGYSSGRLYIETVKRMVETENIVKSTYLYNEKGLLEEEVVWSGVENDEYSVIYQYDSNGLLIKEINDNFYSPYTEVFSYDSNGRLIQSTLTGVVGDAVSKYEYDQNGLLIKKSTGYIDGDVVITYEYDSNGNLIKETLSSGESTVYSDYKLVYRGEIAQSGTLSVITDHAPSWASWSNGDVLCIGNEGKYYVIDKNGKILAGPFDGMVCPDLNGYAVGYVRSKEVVGTGIDDYDNSTFDIVKTTTISYIIDSRGKVICEKTGSATDQFYETVYEGEYIESCSEGMIVTITYSDYFLGLSRNDYTVHIYDIGGNKIADFEGIYEHGTYINGKLVMIDSKGKIFAVDKSGKIVASVSDLAKQHPKFNEAYFNMYYPYISDGHFMSYFPGGYTIIEVEHYWDPADYYHILLSEDMTKSYLLKKSYLYDNRNYGTLVFSKIVENGNVSDGYYLIDVSKCSLDETGMVIPTRDAAVCDREFASGNFYNIFGKDEKYALVSTSDGKWGFLSYDGKTLKLYDDACYFSGGIAAVKDGGEFYIIDENFNRISNSVTGYDAVSVCGNGWFTLRKGDTKVIAVYGE